jgi:O-antigen/teichoic acid export membrane protein
MVPATVDWSFNRWLMKFRTRPAAALPVVRAAVQVVIAAVVVALAALAPAAVAVVVLVAAMIAIVTAVVVTATIRPKQAARNWWKSWFTSTAFRRL